MLNDQVAVSIRQSLLFKYPKGRGPIVVGFDNSLIAQKAGLTSFDQGIDKAAEAAVLQLKPHLRGWTSKDWKECREILVKIKLEER